MTNGTFFDLRKVVKGRDLQIKSLRFIKYDEIISSKMHKTDPNMSEKMYFMRFCLFCPGDLVTRAESGRFGLQPGDFRQAKSMRDSMYDVNKFVSVR